MLRRKSTNAEVPDSAVIEHSSLEIKLGRVDRIYRPGEKVSGVVVVRAKDGWSHKGVILRVEGAAKLQLSNRSLGLFESMSTMKPRVLINDTVEVAPPAKLPAGTSEIPFEVTASNPSRVLAPPRAPTRPVSRRARPPPVLARSHALTRQRRALG